MPDPHNGCKSCVRVWEVTESWALGRCVPPYILYIRSGVLERYRVQLSVLMPVPVQKPLCCHHSMGTLFVFSAFCQLLASEDMPYSAVVLDGLIQKRNSINMLTYSKCRWDAQCARYPPPSWHVSVKLINICIALATCPDSNGETMIFSCMPRFKWKPKVLKIEDLGTQRQAYWTFGTIKNSGSQRLKRISHEKHHPDDPQKNHVCRLLSRVLFILKAVGHIWQSFLGLLG